MVMPFTLCKANFFTIKKKYSLGRLLTILPLSIFIKILDNTRDYAFLTITLLLIAQVTKSSSYQAKIIECKERSLSLLRKRPISKRSTQMKIRTKASK